MAIPSCSAAQRADPSLFASELAAMRPRLMGYARRLTRDRTAADDLVQDTMLRAWKARDRFQRGTSMPAWTCTILKNAFLSQRRKDRHSPTLDDATATRVTGIAGTQEASIEVAEVQAQIEHLPAAQREAILIVAVEGSSYEDASRRTGVPEGTLKSRVCRARVSLQQRIDGGGRDDPAPMPATDGDARDRTDARRAWAIAKATGQPLWIG